MRLRELGLLSYGDALTTMEEEHCQVVQGAKPVVLTVQHPPVVTFGNRGWKQDVPGLLDPSWAQLEAFFKTRGVAVEKTDRGGRATCHEPGQLVVYPIIPLKSVRCFVNALEEALIGTCAHFHVNAQRNPLGPGIWVGHKKIASIGIRVSKGVSRHGLAFNVTNSLETFGSIVPCGLTGVGVTRLLNHCPQVQLSQVESVLVARLLSAFTKYLSQER